MRGADINRQMEQVFDLNLYKSVSADIGLPLFACGGLGS